MSESEEKTKIVHENRLIVFQSRKIRRIWHDDEWFFSVVDICGALTDSENPRDYWYKMKIRVKDEDGFEPSTVCRQLKFEALRKDAQYRLRQYRFRMNAGLTSFVLSPEKWVWVGSVSERLKNGAVSGLPLILQNVAVTAYWESMKLGLYCQ